MSETTVVDIPTRRRVVNLILNEGPQTAKQLAEVLDLTPAAVRRHLTTLLDDGTLHSQEQRVYGLRGRGRPSKVFALTDAGRSEFRQAYDQLALVALRRLVAAAGPNSVREIAHEQFSVIERRFHEERIAVPDKPAIDVLAGVLSQDGFAASIRPLHSGDQLLQHHCPIAHVATEFPVICEIETQLISKLLGSHVQRLATIAHGDGVCTTHVPKPLPTPLIPRRK